MLLLVYTMRNAFAYAVAASAVLSFAVYAQDDDEEPTGTQTYVAPSVYPAFYVYAGVTRGLSYDAAGDITGRAAAYGSSARLEDVGATPSLGVAFDYFFWRGLGAEIKLLHEFGARRAAALKYNVASFPKVGPFLPDANVEERLAYQVQNVDCKVALKFVPFPAWVITPYAAAGVGVNSTMMKLEDRTSDPIIEKYGNGILLMNGWSQRFSFDWAVYGGGQLNFAPGFFIVGEYVYDRPFARHFFANYRTDTRLRGWYAGAGWRFM